MNATSNVETLYWAQDALFLIDQRRLPHELQYVRCVTVAEVRNAIESMVVRGAPAIGIAAAYGVVLAVEAAYKRDPQNWANVVRADLAELKSARPTAVNLAWAIEEMTSHFEHVDNPPHQALLAQAHTMREQDIDANKVMGELGAQFIAENSTVVTHCNAGALATAGYGTALGVIRSARQHKNLRRVFAGETRPWFQGARLTAWELQRDNIPVTLIADSAIAHLMSSRTIDCVITGADRVAANGDVANKIGTYSLAVCARAHGVRFMVVAPTSTIDMGTAHGSQIPIEERAGDELLVYQGSRISPADLDAYNPVFDITPAEYVDVLVTERGVVEKPNLDTIEGLFSRKI
ncbi:MAG: S-methyl-5-thioribose-1-phosphate isomerase [Gammaproteobacteria bacterium]